MSLSKILLLGLLGISVANASYIEIPAHYFWMSGNWSFRPLERIVHKKFYQNHLSDYNFYTAWDGAGSSYSVIALQSGAILSHEYQTNIVFDKTYKTDMAHYQNNQTIPIMVGCTYTYNPYWSPFDGGTPMDNCTGKVYPIVKSGQIDDAGNVITSTYDDTALKSENSILKAKVQALEAKVYQCIP